MIMKIKEIGFCLLYLVSALAGMTLIKLEGQQEGQKIIKILGYPLTIRLILGVICYGISFLLFAVVISKLQISLIMPILSAATNIAIVIIGMTLFQEHLSLGQMTGIGVVIVGTLILGIFSR